MKADHSKLSNKEIANTLRNIAAAHLLTGANRFRTIAYENAADTVEQSTRELRDIWEDGKIYEIPGIGKTIGSGLDELFKTGKSKHFEEVLNKVPAAVFVLMKIPKIGPKKAYKLVNAFNLKNPDTAVAELEAAALKGKIAVLDTFGEKSEQEILESIKLFGKLAIKNERMPLPYAFRTAKEIDQYLKKNSLVKKTDTLGSLRRMVSTIGDVDIAVQVSGSAVPEKEKQIIEHFVKYPKTMRVDTAGKNKASINVPPNIRVDLRTQNSKSYGSMLQYFTGSKSHNIKLREHALRQGYSLNEFGLKNMPGKKETKILEFESEEKLYNFLGLQYIPPELREGTNEIELALSNKIPKLVELKDIKGDLHTHSSYDLKPSHDFGKNSYEEILDYAEKLGYEYVGFTDHNPKMADLSENDIVGIMKKRKEQIEKIQNKNKQVKCFISLEVDIQPDGKIALPEKAIEYVDYLLISVHSSFSQNIESMTKRVLKALSYPKVKVLGHPTGRLMGKREGFELKWEEIFKYCADKNIAVEINSWPERLDLPDSLVREALKYKVKFAIDTDAHAITHLDGMFYGVSVAKRGWCSKSDIINSLPYNEFRKWLLS